MNPFFLALAAAVIVSGISLLGALFLLLKIHKLERFLLIIVAFAAGAMMGNAFLHLMDEGLESLPSSRVMEFTILGFLVFFFIERYIHWHHSHDTGKPDVHPFAYVNLIGDGVHNFIDGIVLAVTFTIDTSLGWATTLAIIFHEIPQEMSDFGVLLYAGLTKKRALFYNFLTALTAILGVIIGTALNAKAESFSILMLPIAAGGFIYIAASDLIPEINKEKRLGWTLIYFLAVLVGLSFMWLMKNLE